MGRIGYFMICEDSQFGQDEHGNLAQVVFNPLINIDVPFLPTAYSLSFVAGIIDVQFKDTITTELIITHKETGEKAYENRMSTPVDLKDKADDYKNWPYIQTGGGLKNIIFKSEGLYQVEFFLDGESIFATDLRVRRQH